MEKEDSDKKHASTNKFWDKILKCPPLLSKEEADSMLSIVKKLRKEHGFRKVK